MKYTIIKTREQYNLYCKNLETLLCENTTNIDTEEEAELLTFLIEKWDAEHNTFNKVDPIKLLKYIMEENSLKESDLATVLQVSKHVVTEILSYKKGLSKEIIIKLAAHFKLSQEAFNKPYKLISPLNVHLRNASVMNTIKHIDLSISDS